MDNATSVLGVYETEKEAKAALEEAKKNEEYKNDELSILEHEVPYVEPSKDSGA